MPRKRTQRQQSHCKKNTSCRPICRESTRVALAARLRLTSASAGQTRAWRMCRSLVNERRVYAVRSGTLCRDIRSHLPQSPDRDCENISLLVEPFLALAPQLLGDAQETELSERTGREGIRLTRDPLLCHPVLQVIIQAQRKLRRPYTREGSHLPMQPSSHHGIRGGHAALCVAT